MGKQSEKKDTEKTEDDSTFNPMQKNGGKVIWIGNKPIIVYPDK